MNDHRFGILAPQRIGERFSLRRVPPRPELAPFVDWYWLVEWELGGQPPHVQEVLPHPCVNLVFEQERAAVHGVGTQMFRTSLEGQGWTLGVKFKPGAFFLFYGESLAPLTDSTLSLEEAFGERGAGWAERVRAAPTIEERVALVEEVLLACRGVVEPQMELAMEAVRLVLEEPDIRQSEELALRLGTSLRSMQRLFQRYVGVSPKWVIRRFRIHEAAERVGRGGAVDWTRLAQDLGYFDQAHFVHDFQDQMGRSPSEYARECRKGSDSVAASV